MCRWKALNVLEDSGRRVLVQIVSEEINHRLVIQLMRHIRVQLRAVQRVAEDQRRSCTRVIKWLDTEMISRAEKSSAARIPNGEGEIANQMLDAVFGPDSVGTRNQFYVRRFIRDRFAC